MMLIYAIMMMIVQCTYMRRDNMALIKINSSIFRAACILLLCTACVEAEGTPADHCTEQINSCACKTDKGYINLEPLDQAKQDGQPKFANIMDESQVDTFWYNPCTDFTANTSCTNVSGCQARLELKYPLGDQASATFKVKPTSGQGIEYIKLDEDGVLRTMFVELMCDRYQEGSLLALGERYAIAQYDFILTTKYACSDIAPAPGGSAGVTCGWWCIGLSALAILMAGVMLGCLLNMVCCGQRKSNSKGKHEKEFLPRGMGKNEKHEEFATVPYAQFPDEQRF